MLEERLDFETATYKSYATEKCIEIGLTNRSFGRYLDLAYRAQSDFQPQNIRLVKQEGRSEDYEFWDVVYALELCRTSPDGEELNRWPIEIEFYIIKAEEGYRIRFFREYYSTEVSKQITEVLKESGR